MKQLKIDVNAREGKGRGPARRLRMAGHIPAIIYGKHSEPRAISVKSTDFVRLLNETAGSKALVEIQQEGLPGTLSVIQEVQKDVVLDRVLHIDFHGVSPDEKMDTSVAIHVIGEAVGVKNEGGIIEVVSHEVSVRCLPKDLPEYVTVDVTELRANDSIHIRNLPEISGVEFLGEPDQVLVSCPGPRVAVEGAAEVAESEAEPA
ncbi:MAG: 50S ribosomal protein L25 [Opitutales bacterium]